MYVWYANMPRSEYSPRRASVNAALREWWADVRASSRRLKRRLSGSRRQRPTMYRRHRVRTIQSGAVAALKTLSKNGEFKSADNYAIERDPQLGRRGFLVRGAVSSCDPTVAYVNTMSARGGWGERPVITVRYHLGTWGSDELTFELPAVKISWLQTLAKQTTERGASWRRHSAN